MRTGLGQDDELEAKSRDTKQWGLETGQLCQRALSSGRWGGWGWKGHPRWLLPMSHLLPLFTWEWKAGNRDAL